MFFKNLQADNTQFAEITRCNTHYQYRRYGLPLKKSLTSENDYFCKGYGGLRWLWLSAWTRTTWCASWAAPAQPGSLAWVAWGSCRTWRWNKSSEASDLMFVLLFVFSKRSTLPCYYCDNQLDLYRRKSSNVRTARFNAGDKEEANLKMRTLSFFILYVLVSKPVMQKENVKQPNKPFFS